MPFWAASADLPLAMVATSMPILPANAENRVPQTYESAIERFLATLLFQMGAGSTMKIRTAMAPAKRKRSLYCLFRNALAPC